MRFIAIKARSEAKEQRHVRAFCVLCVRVVVQTETTHLPPFHSSSCNTSLTSHTHTPATTQHVCHVGPPWPVPYLTVLYISSAARPGQASEGE